MSDRDRFGIIAVTLVAWLTGHPVPRAFEWRMRCRLDGHRETRRRLVML